MPRKRSIVDQARQATRRAQLSELLTQAEAHRQEIRTLTVQVAEAARDAAKYKAAAERLKNQEDLLKAADEFQRSIHLWRCGAITTEQLGLAQASLLYCAEMRVLYDPSNPTRNVYKDTPKNG